MKPTPPSLLRRAEGQRGAELGTEPVIVRRKSLKGRQQVALDRYIRVSLMEGQNGGGEVPNSPQYTGGGHEVVQAEEIPHDQQNERPAINGQNGTPAQDPRLGQEQPEGPDFLKFCSALSLWAGSLAFGGVMAIESGLVGNQARKNAKELFAWCTFLLSAAFVFALFLLMISRVRPAIPNLHMLAGSVSALLLGCLVASVVLAAVIVMK